MTETSENCSVCSKNDISKTGEHWCDACDQVLCAACKYCHDGLNILKHHVTVPVSDYLKLKQFEGSLNRVCETHEDLYQLFCQSHDEFLCLHCMKAHQTCNKFVPISKLAKGIKESERMRDIEDRISDLTTNAAKIEKLLNSNLKSVETQTDAVLVKVSKIRKQIDDRLDERENKIIEEIKNLRLSRKTDVSLTLDIINEVQRKSEILESQIETLRKCGTDTQVLFQLMQMSAKLSKNEETIVSLITQQTLNNVEIILNDDKVETILSSVDLGKLCTNIVQHQIEIVTSKAKQAQEESSRDSCSLAGIECRPTPKFSYSSFRTSHRICACEPLPDGKIIFSDAGCSLYVVDQNGIQMYKFSVGSYNSYSSIACIDNRIIGVVCYRFVCIVDIVDKCLLHSLCSQPFDITCANGFLVCCKGKSLDFITPNGRIEKILRINATNVVGFNDKLLYTTNNDSIYNFVCCDLEGTAIWTFTSQEQYRSITVDSHGHIYAALKTEIAVISPDGTNSRKLLSNQEISAFGIKFDKSGNR